MHRVYAFCIGVLLIFSQPPALVAREFRAGKHYFELSNPSSLTPEVICFFAFHCFQCERLEKEFALAAALRSAIGPDIPIKHYCVDFGPHGDLAVEAWSLAMVLGVTEAIQMPLFRLYQEHLSTLSRDQVQQAFFQAGVSPLAYLGAEKSFFLSNVIHRQKKTALSCQVRAVPVIVVNNKYRIEVDGFEQRDPQSFVQACAECVRFLLAKDQRAAG